MKIFFVDIDGTLRNSNGIVTERTKDAIRAIVKQGDLAILCTGRARDYAYKVAEDCGALPYLISSSGGDVYDFSKEKLIYENPMDSNEVIRLYNIAKRMGLRFIMASNGKRYVNIIKHENEEILLTEPIEEFVKENKVIQCSMGDSDFDKINSLTSEVEDSKTIKIVNRSKSLLDESILPIGTTYFDISDINTSKGNGIKKLCEYLGVDFKNTYAIGDDINDVSMFEIVETSVAMDNTREDVKKNVFRVIPSNDDDGLAMFLEEFIEKGD